MSRICAIIGLGEACLRERAEGAVADGLAALVWIAAARLGDRGILLSRIGQDAKGDELLHILQREGVETKYLQRDPDLPTARVTERAASPPNVRFAHEKAAFDNLQPDFDLEDVAAFADGVVFGLVARRFGQTRSEEDRFLDRCRGAVRMADLTNRLGGSIDRAAACAAVDRAEVVILDGDSRRAVASATKTDAKDLCIALARSSPARFVVLVEHERDARRVLAGSADAGRTDWSSLPGSMAAWHAFQVGLLHHLILEEGIIEAFQHAVRISQHAHEHRDGNSPESLRSVQK